jgi:hypothetical protein
MLGRSAMTSPREEDKQCKFLVSHQALSCVLLPLIVVILIYLSIYVRRTKNGYYYHSSLI